MNCLLHLFLSIIPVCVLSSLVDFDHLSSDVGEPLFLTKYIESNKIEQGREAAFVDATAWGVEGIKSYSGYLTVNKTFNSNLFFWYFPSEKKPESAPVVVWLQGGPGSPSMYGLFEEHGPFYFDKKGTVRRRQYSWSRALNMIYIDSPVGTGYSFTESDEGYAKDQVQVGQDLLSALLQFYKLFPELTRNELFITGESYGGKYVPAFAYTIHINNLKNTTRINLKGIAIGNGIIDPETMMDFGEHLYEIGLIDSETLSEFKSEQEEIVSHIKQGEFKEATDGYMKLILNGYGRPLNSLFFNATGFSLFYNLLHDEEYSPYGDSNTFIQTNYVRKPIHVGNLLFNNPSKVEGFLYEDITKTVKPWFQELIENYRVLLYSGQLDLIIPYAQTLDFLQSLEWSGADLYKKAERKQWRVGEAIAGYSKSIKNFTEVLVRNAGHMVPLDQPLWAYDLITRFTLNMHF